LKPPDFSTVVSVIALVVSAATAWLTLFRRGTIHMTQPNVIFFGPDDRGLAKVFLRTLLVATAKRGRIIESLYLVVTLPDGTKQSFNIWVYGDKSLSRGSGLFVGDTGVEANHHFMMTDEHPRFFFSKGWHSIDVYAHLLGSRHRAHLFSQRLLLLEEHEEALHNRETGLYFDWFPDQSSYVPHIDKRLNRFSAPTPASSAFASNGFVTDKLHVGGWLGRLALWLRRFRER
jgi:hypothetical protein